MVIFTMKSLMSLKETFNNSGPNKEKDKLTNSNKETYIVKLLKLVSRA